MNGESVPNIAQVVNECSLELARDIEGTRSMVNHRHGFMLIYAYLSELKREVESEVPDRAAMRKGASRVAALAMRFMLDVCGGSANGEPTDPKD